MKFNSYSSALIIAFIALPLFSQDQKGDFLKETFPLLQRDEYRNISVIVEPDHPKPCPPEFENVLSNRNLLSIAEAKRVNEVILKYQNITTNSRLAGAVFKGWVQRQPLFPYPTNRIPVALYVYTNSSAKEEIGFLYGSRQVVARYRTTSNDGYDVLINDGLLSIFQEFKQGVLGGLYLGFSDASKLTSLLRLKDEKAFGRYLAWDNEGRLAIQLEFKKPFDFLKYQTVKMDLAWTEAPTNTTNPAHTK